MDNIPVESDSELVINSNLGRTTAPSQIINHVRDILNLVSKFDIVQFNYCNKSQNFPLIGS